MKAANIIITVYNLSQNVKDFFLIHRRNQFNYYLFYIIVMIASFTDVI